MKKNKLLILLAASISLTAFASAQTTGTTVSTGTATTSVATGTATSSGDELDGLDLDNLDLEDTGTASSKTAANMSWGFSSGDMVVVKESSGDSVTLGVPAIKDGAGNEIKRFKVSYSTTSVAETEPTSLQQANFEFDEITGSTVMLQVTGLNVTSPMYFVVEPINKDNNAGQVSTEVTYSPEQHGAATGSTATLSDVTYSYSGMEVTLKWTPIQGATKVEVYFKTEDTEDYTKVGDAKMTDGTFNFVLTKAGNSYVKLIPTDDNGAPFGPEIVKSLKVDTTVAPEVKKVPKVGPATDLMIALIALSVLGYGIYRYRKIA